MESNKVICKVCNEMKDRICVGMFASGKNRRYVDNNNKLWNGRQCPECHRKSVKNNMQKVRSIKKLINENM